MKIRLRDTGQIITEREFRAMNPQTSFPAIISESILDAFGADVVFEGPQAQTTTPYDVVVQSGVEQASDGKWYTKTIVGPIFADTKDKQGNVTATAAENEASYRKTVDDRQANMIRQQRNRKLAETDWTQGRDIPDSTALPWAAYRQALRDLPSQPEFPWNVSWPDKPA